MCSSLLVCLISILLLWRAGAHLFSCSVGLRVQQDTSYPAKFEVLCDHGPFEVMYILFDCTVLAWTIVELLVDIPAQGINMVPLSCCSWREQSYSSRTWIYNHQALPTVCFNSTHEFLWLTISMHLWHVMYWQMQPWSSGVSRNINE